jgi:hypothetical protein
MLDKLTPQQELLIPQYREKWLKNFFNSGDELDIEAFKKGITFIYSLVSLKDPVKVYVDSPLGLQYACQMLKKIKMSDQVPDQVWGQVLGQVRGQVRGQVSDQVWGQVRGQVSDQVRGQVSDQVWGQVRGQVSDQVRGQVWGQVRGQVSDQVSDQVLGQVLGQVRDQVRGQVWGQVRDQVRGQVWGQVGKEYETFAGIGLGQDSGWVSFYDFFTDIKVINNEKFNQYKEFIESGVYDTILFNNFAIGCRRPNFVGRDTQNRMHSDVRSAISWRDGFELYYLAGVHFPKELWQKVVSGKMSFKQILDIENTEQRLQAMRFNPNALLKENPQLVHESKRGNKLYVIENSEVNKIYAEPKVWLLGFTDPSKLAPNNVMYEEVDPKLAEATPDADVVQAFHLGLDYDQYKKLQMET